METTSLAARGLYPQAPPAFQSRDDINPTLLMSWWATIFSLAIIIVRLCGRYIRIERFFPEDKIVMLSVIPLIIRMVLVHFVLIFGTNNTQTAGLTQDQIDKRVIGSKLVLAARIFYAIFIWTAKLTVCEFLKRVTGMAWRKSVTLFLRFIHFFLVSTLVAVVIATLAECQPIDHYWQVVPDPGPSCRSGYAQLITMGACDVITDLLLVAFPVPIILMAQISLKRKFALVVLFCLSLILVAITCYRVPTVIERRGAQPYRSLVASLEILAATAVSNLVVIGSFVRDSGVKKLKYKRAQGSASVTESMGSSYVRRNTVMQHQWGSDSDLAGDLGIRLDPKLHSTKLYSSEPGSAVPIPTPPVPLVVACTGSLDPTWSFNQDHASDDDHISTPDSLDIKVSPREYLPTSQSPRDRTPSSSTPLSRRVSFFDVGGLLELDELPTQRPELPSRHTIDTSLIWPFDLQHQPRGSRAFLEDLGVLAPRIAAPNPRSTTQSPVSSPPSINIASTVGQFSHTPPPYRASPGVSPDGDVELQDVGGLLERHTQRP